MVSTSFGAKLKIHTVKQASSIVIEAAPLDDNSGSSSSFQFVRICHLDFQAEVETDCCWQVGPYAACPIQQNGDCKVEFWDFSIGPREESVHSSEL